MSDWDYKVAEWKRKLAEGKVLPQTRSGLCDWIQHPLSKKWVRAWDIARKVGWFSTSGKAFRKTTHALKTPDKLPKGDHIISPEEAREEGKQIPEAKITALRAQAIKRYIRQFPVWQPLLSKHCDFYPVAILDMIAGIPTNQIRMLVFNHIWVFRSAPYVNIKTYDDVAMPIVGNAFGPSKHMETLADSCLILALMPHYRAQLPAVIAKHKGKHKTLAKYEAKVDPLAQTLAFQKADRSAAHLNPNIYVRKAYQQEIDSNLGPEAAKAASIVAKFVRP